MTAYYNEFDPSAAAWLRELIKEGLIADGHVDTRSIADVGPSDLDGFTQCHFFAGIGGWSYALRLAGWPDDQAVWTGSCPCQPFSLAGAQKGFDDPRHLWPQFRRLIAERRPTIVFGEQVASATQWLGLVRSDLEALEYAVGAMPIQAASAGADHLRDRFWFVGHDTRDGWGEGRPQHEIQLGQSAAAASDGGLVHATEQRRKGEQDTAGPTWRPSFENPSDSGIGNMADTHHAGSQRRPLLPERAGERTAGPDGVAHAHQLGASEGRQQRSGEQRGPGGDQEPCNWVIGADGKARRVKPGICLLANGVSGRVVVRRASQQGSAEIQEHWYNRIGALRGFGNAIDPRPAAAFIKAAAGAIA